MSHHRGELIEALQSTFRELRSGDDELDERTATVLISVVERFLWIEAGEELGFVVDKT